MSSERSLSKPLFGKGFHTFAQLNEQVALSIALRFGFD
jgi:hypothetical protein